MGQRTQFGGVDEKTADNQERLNWRRAARQHTGASGLVDIADLHFAGRLKQEATTVACATVGIAA
jgi:hypothetical protein